MSTRPLFIPDYDSDNFVKSINIEFSWFPGFHVTQKQKSISSLHESIKTNTNHKHILEISTKSHDDVGKKLSAFNLMLTSKDNIHASVESFYQGSKIFEHGGPYEDIYLNSSVGAKKDLRLKKSGKLIGFKFKEESWGLDDHFYDWLYLIGLLQNNKIANYLLSFDGFTDIEFNPKKSYNCQAHSAALYLSALHRGIDLEKIKSPKFFKEVFPNNTLYKFSQAELF
ncbi:hypothetical protein OAL98_00910 [Gammaproteobacteria bacterium]|nr:hypothetical protein [Gammaproteobacteria bacterium]